MRVVLQSAQPSRMLANSLQKKFAQEHADELNEIADPSHITPITRLETLSYEK
jgi:hypothetical protein